MNQGTAMVIRLRHGAGRHGAFAPSTVRSMIWPSTLIRRHGDIRVRRTNACDWTTRSAAPWSPRSPLRSLGGNGHCWCQLRPVNRHGLSRRRSSRRRLLHQRQELHFGRTPTCVHGSCNMVINWTKPQLIRSSERRHPPSPASCAGLRIFATARRCVPPTWNPHFISIMKSISCTRTARGLLAAARALRARRSARAPLAPTPPIRCWCAAATCRHARRLGCRDAAHPVQGPRRLRASPRRIAAAHRADADHARAGHAGAADRSSTPIR